MYIDREVRFYNQTGFNSVDIPENPKLLETQFTPYKILNNVNIIQTEYLAHIIVDEFSPEEARKIDYVIIVDKNSLILTKSAYTVENFEFLADGTCKFNLLLDAYNTLGGFAIDSGNQILGGSAKRLTVGLDEDNTKYFTLDEPFRPSTKYKTEFKELIPTTQESDELPLIETLTIPPISVEGNIKNNYREDLVSGIKIKKITADTSGDWTSRQLAGGTCGEYIVATEQTVSSGTIKGINANIMITSQAREMQETELITMLLSGGNTSLELGVRWWNGYRINAETTLDGKTIKSDLITDMRLAGRDEDISNYWCVPQKYFTISSEKDYSMIENNPENYGGIKSIENKIINTNINITPYTVYNNKARYKQSIEIKIFSSASGEEINKEVFEVLASGTTPNITSFNIEGKVTADIRPEGHPIFLFSYNNQTLQIDNLCEHIKGANWRKISLGINGLSGENYARAQIKTEKKDATFGALGQVLLGLAQIGVGVGTAVASGGASIPASATMMMSGGGALVGQGALSYLSASARQKQQSELLNAQGINASSDIQIGNSNYVRDIGKNIFYAMITSYSDEDMIAYDTFLTRYGYNVGNKVLQQTDFYSRPAFNFVQINDIDIESVTGNINLIEKVKEQLKAGVRVWHKKPNYNDMLAGGNR